MGESEIQGEGSDLDIKVLTYLFHTKKKEGSVDTNASILQTSKKAVRFTGRCIYVFFSVKLRMRSSVEFVFVGRQLKKCVERINK